MTKYNQKLKRLRKKADGLYQQVGLQNNPKCSACGNKAQVIHHFVPKSLSNNLRYDLLNGIPLCNSCHFKHHTTNDPVVYERMTSNKSAEWFQYIRDNRDKTVKTNAKFYEDAIKRLEKLL